MCVIERTALKQQGDELALRVDHHLCCIFLPSYTAFGQAPDTGSQPHRTRTLYYTLSALRKS